MRILAAILGGLVLLNTACQGTPPHRDPHRDAAPSAGAPELREGEAFKASDLLPLREIEKQFEVTEGARRGKFLEARVVDHGDNAFTYTLEDTRSVSLETPDEGGVVVPREKEFHENVEIVYEPALYLLPPELSYGDIFERTCGMTVLNLQNGHVRDRGKCSYRVELIDVEDIDTPAGPFRAYLVRSSRKIDLNLAKVDVTVETWYVPGQGAVMERIDQLTKALGLFGIPKREELKLREVR